MLNIDHKLNSKRQILHEEDSKPGHMFLYFSEPV